MVEHQEKRATNRATFVAATTAISNGDYDALESLVADDLVFDLPYGPSFMPNPVVGRDAWMEMSRSTFEMFTSFRLEIDEMHDALDPDLLIAEYRSDAIVAHNNNAYLNRYVGILRFRDGQISAWREFHNPEATKAMR